MRPGETTPVGQAMVVAPVAAALAVQSQSTHWMTPAPSTSTWPPCSTLPGTSTLPPVMSCAVVPAVTWQTPLASGGSIACGHSTTIGPPLPPVAGVSVQSASQPSPATLLPSSHCSGGCTIPSPQRGGLVGLPLPQPKAVKARAARKPRCSEKRIGALEHDAHRRRK